MHPHRCAGVSRHCVTDSVTTAAADMGSEGHDSTWMLFGRAMVPNFM